MRNLAHGLILVAALLPATAGCKGPYALQAQQTQQQMAAISAEKLQLQARVNELDSENQQANQLLAQSQQQVQILNEQTDAYRQQLLTATTQVERMREVTAQSRQRAETLTASVRQRGGAMIAPNNSLQSNLPLIDVPGANVRRDGDTVRIELSSDQIFEPGTTELRTESLELLQSTANEVLRRYPRQRIGVEGHTSRDVGGASHVPHQQTLAQSLAVFKFLTNRTALTADKLTVAGHGDTRPLFSNASDAGRARNRRIEIVIYPETVTSSR